jgi:hypothetical protein
MRLSEGEWERLKPLGMLVEQVTELVAGGRVVMIVRSIDWNRLQKQRRATVMVALAGAGCALSSSACLPCDMTSPFYEREGVSMARVVQVTIDAQDPHRLAKWWADLLGYEVEDGHDFVQSLLDDGTITAAEVVRVDGRLAFAGAAAASDPEELGPRLHFQREYAPKAVKNRVHLDVPVEPTQLESEVERLQTLGAQLVTFKSRNDDRWANMLDPEGNEFCLQ